jgi:hypothetical protein
MAERTTDTIVRNLIEALNRLHSDLERVEIWTAALKSFREPAPEYQPDQQDLLTPGKRTPPEQ